MKFSYDEKNTPDYLALTLQLSYKTKSVLFLILFCCKIVHLPKKLDNCKCKLNSCFNQEHLSIAWTSSRKWSKSSAGV